MTDEELIRLVQETPAEELTPEQVEQLRIRLRESPALQEVLIDQLHMETYLNSALGEVQISVDEIVRRARETKSAAVGRTAAWLLGLGLASIAVFVGVAQFFPEQLGRNVADPELVADADANAPATTESDKANSAENEDLATNEPGDTTGRVAGEPNTKTAVAIASKTSDTEPSAAVAAENATAAPAQPVKPPVETGPWTELLSDKATPVAFEASSFDLQDESAPELPADELRKWLAQIPGLPHRIDERRWGNRRFSGIDGLARLRAPWTSDAVLRLGLFDATGFKLHLWNGDEGVTLQFYERPRPRLWGAFRATRENGKPQPKQLALLTTDDGRHERSELGTIELRHQDGALVMTRGDVRLLSVPMPAPPQEVIFEGRTWFTTLTMFRGKPAPAEGALARRSVLPTGDPADLQWVSELADVAEFNRSGDGSVELLTEARPEPSKKVAWSGTPVGRPGLYEVIARVEAADPGTGIYLGDAQGHPIHHVAFFRDRRSGQSSFGYGWSTYGYESPGELRTEIDVDPLDRPAPFAGADTWLRIVAGPAGLKLWSSGDGKHWGRALSAPVRDTRGTWSSIGLFAIPGKEPRSVRLRNVTVRELTPIVSLAPPELLEQVSLVGPADQWDIEAWLARVIDTLPDGVDIEDWLLASAVRTLEAGPSRELANYLLEHLADRGVQRKKTTEEQIAFLDDIMLLADGWGAGDGARLALDYVELIEPERRRSSNAGALVASALITSPLWTEAKITAAPPALVRPALVAAVYRGDWPQTRELARRVRYWSRHAGPEPNRSHEEKLKHFVVDWADFTAAQNLPAKERGDVPLVPREWGHPLISQLSKEGYNVMAEFESALAGKAYEDACQIISAAGTSGLLGMLPDAKDPELLVSMPRAVALAMRDHPDLRTAMQERFGQVGLLRVRQATADANVAAVQEATVQFYGTDAAAEAHAWLADRALAGGQFSQAADNYRDALRHASPGLARDISTRMRLAEAMLGRDGGEPPQTSVEIGGRTMSPAEFEKLIADLRATRTTTASPAEPRTPAGSQSTPPPARYEPHIRGRFDGDLGQNAGKGPGDTDWTARQLAVTTDEEFLYVSNRFQTTAYDLKTGAAKWHARLGGDQGEAHDWAYVAMRPVVAGDQVFVRRLTKNGPELAALERATGQLQWRNRPDSHVASDPVYTRGELVAVIATFPEGGYVQLDLASFHPETGSVLAQRPLMRLRDVWNRRPVCQIATAAGKIVCSVGGSVICCDVNGQSNWVSRQSWLPSEADQNRHLQYHESPLIVEAEQVRDGRVFAAQAGVRAVSCLELDTGRRLWTTAIPELRRVLGVAGAQLIAETGTALVGLDRTTGDILWTRDVENLLDAHLGREGKPLLVTRAVKLADDQMCPLLVWIDPATGAEIVQHPLRPLANKVVQMGPMVAVGERIWTFFGKAINEPQRDLVELVPAGELPVVPDENPLAAWSSHVHESTRQAAAAVLPGWTLLTRQTPGQTVFRAEQRGERGVLATRTETNRPVRFARPVTIAAGAQPRLKIRAGLAAGSPWKLQVRVDGEEQVAVPLDDAATANGWKTVEVELKEFAGRTVWVVVEQARIDGGPAGEGFWKSLEISGR